MSAPRIGPDARSQVDRRAGVQELAGPEPEHLRRGRDVDQRGRDVEHRGERPLVGGTAAAGRPPPRRGRPRCRHRRAPVDAGDGDGLVGDRVGEQVRTDVDDRAGGGHAESSDQLDGPARRAGVGQVHLGARRRRAPGPGGPGPAGRPRCRRRRRPRAGRSRRARARATRRGRARRRGRAPRRAAARRSPGRPRRGRGARGGSWGRSSGARGRRCSASSPKSTKVCPAPARGEQGRLAGEGAAHEQAAQHATQHATRPGAGRARHRPGRHVAPEPAQHRLGRGGEVGRPAPSSATRRGWRACRRTPRSRRRPRRPAAWRPARSARPPGPRRAGAWPRGSRAPAPRLERSRPPTPSADETPTPAWSSRASTCWHPVPDAATMPTGPGETTLAKPRPRPPTTAVPQSGPITNRRALGRESLERDLLVDGDVVAEHHHVVAGLQGVDGLHERARAGDRHQRDPVRRTPERAAGRPRRRLLGRPAVAAVGVAQGLVDPGERGGAAPRRRRGAAPRRGRWASPRRGRRTPCRRAPRVEGSGHRDLGGAHAVEPLHGPGDLEQGDGVGVGTGPELDVGGHATPFIWASASRPPSSRPRPELWPTAARAAAPTGAPRAASQAANSGITSPCIAHSRRVADSRVVRCEVRPHRGVDLGRRHAGGAVHREPAAEHVVVVRREAVTAPDHPRHVAGRRRRPAPSGAARARVRRRTRPTRSGSSSRHSSPSTIAAAATSRRSRWSSPVRSAHGTAVARDVTTPTQRPATSTYTASRPRWTTGTGPSGADRSVLPHRGAGR